MSHRSALRTAARAIVCVLTVVSLPASICAQVAPGALAGQPTATRGSPLDALGLDAATGLPQFAARTDAISDLAALAVRADRPRLLLQDVALGDGRRVALDLRSIDLDRLRFGFQVDGSPAPGLLDGLELSVWSGAVVGEPGSEALLSFSTRGTWGWVRGSTAGDARANEPVHLMSQAGNGDWNQPLVVLARDSQLAERGLTLHAQCQEPELESLASSALDARPGHDAFEPKSSASKSGSADAAPDCAHWECGMAIETDFQFYQQFGDLGAASSYLATLLAAVSERYEEQINTRLFFPYVQFYLSPADPWTTPDGTGDSVDMLLEFEAAWIGAVPAGARLGHLISGANLGGGVAWVGVLGDGSQTYTFAVSGNADGDTPFPIAVGPLNWDFVVVAHETGHNFSSPHTHDFLPPIDQCAMGLCITDGTLMSYCHLCPGGLNNITTYFHPLCVDLMQAHAGENLPFTAPLVAVGAQPTVLPPYEGVPLTVEVHGSPVGPVMLNYRYGSTGSFAIKPANAQGGGLYGATLPAAPCGALPEWYFSVNDAACGFFTTPISSAEVGNLSMLVHDDLEVDTGWIAGDPGDTASSGLWERGAPIGTGAQPDQDVTDLGFNCFFTGQGSFGGAPGENDVDNGFVTLFSPPIDLSSGDARIGYWRWYSNNGGGDPNTDVFTVDISNDGSTWVNVETVGPTGADTGGNWRHHEFEASDFVTPTANVQLRFIAADAGAGSLVEAAVDELTVFRMSCDSICQADVGFGGPGTSQLSVCGGDLSLGTGAILSLTGAEPGQTAFLFASTEFLPTSAQGGVLVPVPPTLRYFLPINGAGTASFSFAGGGGPLSLYVQAAYVQPSLPAPYWAFSNVVRVDLQP